MKRTSIGGVAVACILALGSPVHAQNVQAEALFQQGDTLLKQGDYAKACEAFEGSNRIEPRAGTLIRLGECREANGQLASAWSAYKDALSRVKDPRKRAVAEAKVQQIEPRLSRLTIVVPDAHRVPGLAIEQNGKSLDTAVWNLALPVDGGDTTVVVKAPGHDDWRTTIDIPIEKGNVRIEVPKFGAPAAKPADASEPIKRADVVAEPSPSRWTQLRYVAVGAAGLAVIGAGGGILFGMQARDKEREALALCSTSMTTCADADRANELLDIGSDRALISNIAFGVAGAAVITAGVLWIVGAPSSAERQVAVVPSAGAATVVVSGRF